MIKVPFDTPDHGTSERASYMIRVDLEHTLDNAYKTMDWFKFLADKAIRVEIIGTQKNTYTTTTVVGFELDPKNETFYRLKYERFEK
jgi:hypothetical protein